jgi:hypothetical protein
MSTFYYDGTNSSSYNGESTIVINSNVTSIPNNAFEFQSTLTTLTFESNSQLQTIGENAFKSATNLASLNIPASVTSIGESSFEEITYLTTLTFESNSQLQTIGDYAFKNASNLASLNIPASVTSIGDSAFEELAKLTTLTFESNSQLQAIGDYAFKNASILTSLNIPDSVTSIGNFTFSYMTALTTLTFESNSQLEIIGENAFEYASILTSISIPASVTSIGDYAFSYTYALVSFEFGSNSQLQKINDNLFTYASSLTSIIIPNKVNIIGNYAFSFASALEKIEFEPFSRLETIGSYTFTYNSGLSSIHIPSFVSYIGENAFLYSNLKNVGMLEVNNLNITSPSTNVSFYGATVDISPPPTRSSQDCYYLSSSEIDFIFNTYIMPYLQSIPLNMTDVSGTTITGTLDNINFTNEPAVPIILGDKTTAGYYVDLDLYLENVTDIIDFDISGNISQTICNDSVINDTTANVSVNYTYNSDISVHVTVTGGGEVYIPQVNGEICAVCCCGDPVSSCCYDTCDCYNGELTPSTYSSDLMIPFTYTGTIKLGISTGTLNVSYMFSPTKPSVSDIEVINIPAFPNLPPIYITNITITEFTLALTSISATGIPTPPGGWSTSQINNKLQSEVDSTLIPTMNTIFQNMCIELNFVNLRNQ